MCLFDYFQQCKIFQYNIALPFLFLMDVNKHKNFDLITTHEDIGFIRRISKAHL